MLNQSGRMPSGGTNPGTDGQMERLGLGVGSFGGVGAGMHGGVGTAGGEIVGQGRGDSVGVGSFGGSDGNAGSVTFCGAWPTPV